MRILAVGDIHGCLVALDALLGLVRPGPEDQLVALGDYVDRGPDTRAVLDRMIELHAGGRVVALRGNHDVMMVQARSGLDARLWLSCGGRETLASYGVAATAECDLSAVPEAHWKFLEETCVDWHEADTHFFVHGSAYPNLPLADQPPYMLHWEKLGGPVAHTSGKVMVCGHTKQPSGRPLNLGTTVCIDTGVYEPHGWLTCLDVATGRYWQANQRGQTRCASLAEPV